MKIKPPSKNKNFSEKVNAERVYRNVNISKKDFIRLKFKSLEVGEPLFKLLDNSLNNLLTIPLITIPKYNQNDITKKTVSITPNTLQKVKIYAIKNNLKMNDILLYALYDILFL